MTRANYKIYEIWAAASGLAIVTLFGMLSFLPFEIMWVSEGQQWTWGMLFTVLGALAGFFGGVFISRKQFPLVKVIIEAIGLLLAIIALTLYYQFISTLAEPWLQQGAWFLRYHGVFMGFLTGIVAFKTALAINDLVIWVRRPGIEIDLKKHTILGTSEPVNYTGLLIILTASYLAVLLWLYGTYGFNLVLLAIILANAGSFLLTFGFLRQGISVVSLINKSEPLVGSSLDNSMAISNPPKNNYDLEKPIKLKDRFVAAVERHGGDTEDAKALMDALIGFGIVGFLIICLIPLNISPIRWFPLSIHQIMLYVWMFCLFFLFVGRLFSGSKYIRFYAPELVGRQKLAGFLGSMRVLGLFLTSSILVYYFDYPVYIPQIVPLCLLGVAGGAVFYWIIGRLSQRLNIRRVLYISAIIALVVDVLLLYYDGIIESWSFYNPLYETVFPFQWLHSPGYILLTGIPIGIVFSEIFLEHIFIRTDGRDAALRGTTLCLTGFLWGVALVGLTYVMESPGGDINAYSTSIFVIVSFIFIGIFSLGLIYYIILEWILPRRGVKLQKDLKTATKNAKKNESRSSRPLKVHSIQMESLEIAPSQRKIMAICIMSGLMLTMVCGFVAYTSFQQNCQKPIIAEANGDFYVWIQNSAERVPRQYPIALASSPRIEYAQLNLAKNEYGAIQIVWHPLKSEAESLSYRISDFISLENPALNISASKTHLRQVEYVIDGEFPDKLVPFSQAGLMPKVHNPLWFDIRVPSNATAGFYDGIITFIRSSGEEIPITIRIMVWNFAVPVMRHLRTNIGSNTNNYNETRNYLAHRMNDYGVYMSYSPYLADLMWGSTCNLNFTTHVWTFNWTNWDNQTSHRLLGGMNAFNVGYPLGLGRGKEGRTPYIDNATAILHLQDWFASVYTHLIDKNWLQYAYLYFIDEFQMFIPENYTREQYFSELKILLQAIRDVAPELKIMATAPPSPETAPLYDYIDIFCPQTYHRDQAAWDERLAAGIELWMYPCVSPMAPWPNSHLYNRLYECRVLLWQVWLYQIHGFLYWQSQGYYHGSYGMGYNGYGDGWFIYTGRYGEMYDSIRWENYLDAQEDYEYLWMLNAALHYAEANPGLVDAALVQEYRKAFQACVASVVGEGWEYCDSALVVLESRQQVASMLIELGKTLNLTAISEAPWLPPPIN